MVKAVNLQDILTEPFSGSESLGRFNGSVAFASTQFPINPGQAGTFPVLSVKAKVWEKYKFDKLEFEFRTTINEFTANALGRVILGVDYDAEDPAPATRSQAENSRPVTAEAPYFGQLLRLKASDMHDVTKYHFIRPGALPGGADIRLYDVGNLNFSTDGNINANEVGELWVHYSGHFKNQILESATSAPTNTGVSVFASTGAEAAGATTVATTMLYATASTNPLQIVNTAGSMVPPAGNYLVSYTVTGQGSAANFFGVNADLQKNAASVFAAGNVPQQVTSVAAGGNSFTAGTTVFVSANGTDAFRVRATDQYSAGTATNGGLITWKAV